MNRPGGQMLQEIPREFISVSRQIGADGLLIQGGGGNTSIKTGADTMWVKASGKWLQRAEAEDVFVAVDWGRVNDNIAQGHDDPVQGTALPFGPAGLRPSIETTLHSLMPHRVVFHTHSINTIVHAIQPGAEAMLRPLLKGIKWGFVGYSKPGLPLTRGVAAVLAQGHCDVLVIENHGLVVGGDSVGETSALMQMVETRLATEPRAMLPPQPGLVAEACANTDFMAAPGDIIHQLALRAEGLALASAGSLYPDHVVFLGSAIARADSAAELRAFCRAESDD
ncbi:MAG: class II aldolase/adducin family protein, partial [Alphaproteobacteria bacterium]|nr:class II aldolase/adducin family protein [Alphaproteobacteria bacterium]